MKLRRVSIHGKHTIQGQINGKWLNLDRVKNIKELIDDLSSELAILRISELPKKNLEQIASELSNNEFHEDENAIVCLPFVPKSFRDFMLFEDHVIDSSRGYVKRFLPKLFPITQTYEKVTGRPFPKFKPHSLWYRQPIYYLSNHLNVLTSGSEVMWPSYTEALDYELELGAVLSKPLLNASPEEAAAAIGGYVVLNDFSARDVQKDEMESGFGPQKAKHFYSSMSANFITADEINLEDTPLSGSVSINGRKVAECSTEKMAFSFAEAISFVSRGEQLHCGELFGSGTLPGGAGMENGHWLRAGDDLSLTLEPIGEVRNTIAGR